LAPKSWKQKRVAPEARMELTEHLDELRDRLIWSLLALVIGVFCIGLPLSGFALDLLQRPIQVMPAAERHRARVEVLADGSWRFDAATMTALSQGEGELERSIWEPSRLEFALPDGRTRIWGVGFRNQLFYFDPLEPVLMQLKAALFVGFLAAFPVVAWNLWAFAAPGLTPRERRFALPFLGSAMALFPLGALFAYFSMSYALYFLFQYSGDFVPALGLKAFVSFEMMMMLVMGVVFEFPVVALALTRLGIINPEQLAAQRPYAIVGIMTFSAVMTPPDPFTMLAMGIPLCLMFELSLMLARLPMFRPQPADSASDGEPAEETP
jgi:sec-independent protein translocase protein TatC